MIEAGIKAGGACQLKRFVDSLQNDESLQRRWLHAKGVHLDDVSVPTYDAVRDAFRDAHNRDRKPVSPPPKRRKSARQPKKKQ